MVICGFLGMFSWSYAAFCMSFHGQMRLSDLITYCIKEEVLESTNLTIFIYLYSGCLTTKASLELNGIVLLQQTSLVKLNFGRRI
jgi:hypothetical protein